MIFGGEEKKVNAKKNSKTNKEFDVSLRVHMALSNSLCIPRRNPHCVYLKNFLVKKRLNLKNYNSFN